MYSSDIAADLFPQPRRWQYHTRLRLGGRQCVKAGCPVLMQVAPSTQATSLFRRVKTRACWPHTLVEMPDFSNVPPTPATVSLTAKRFRNGPQYLLQPRRRHRGWLMACVQRIAPISGPPTVPVPGPWLTGNHSRITGIAVCELPARFPVSLNRSPSEHLGLRG